MNDDQNAATSHRANGLLAAMAEGDFARLRPHLDVVELEPRMTLSEAGERIKHLYFPHSAVICRMAVMRESEIAETATIGPEGVAGFEALLGPSTAMNRMVVQVSGTASRIPVRELAAAVRDSPSLQALLLRYVGAFLVQVTQSVACNSLHKLDARCCRWLLMAHDRARRDSFNLTQEFMAEMLGVHRPTVTNVARGL